MGSATMTVCGAAGCTADAAGLLAAAAPLPAMESGAAVAAMRVVMTGRDTAMARAAQQAGRQGMQGLC